MAISLFLIDPEIQNTLFIKLNLSLWEKGVMEGVNGERGGGSEGAKRADVFQSGYRMVNKVPI